MERVINYDDLPMESLWDGSPILRTANCDGCRFLVMAQRDNVGLEICAWGVAWKALQKIEKPARCIKIGKNPPKFSSLLAINRLYENRN